MAAPRHAVRVNPRFPVRVNMADPDNGAPDNIALAWNLFQPDPIIGPDAVFSVASANYDEAGNNIGLNPRIDAGKGLWMGGKVSNLLPVGAEASATWFKSGVSLTGYIVTATTSLYSHYIQFASYSYVSSKTYAFLYRIKPQYGQRFCQILGSNAAFSSAQYAVFDLEAGVVTYSTGGTAFIWKDESDPTRYWCSWAVLCTTSGESKSAAVVFTPDGAAPRLPVYAGDGIASLEIDRWMVTESSVPVPYVPPGATQPTNAATTGGNGVNIPLDAGLLECFQGKPDGVELIKAQADREFSSDTGFWLKDSGIIISGGVCNLSTSGATNGIYHNFGITTSGTRLLVQFDLSISSGAVETHFGGNTRGTDITTSGRKSIIITANTGANGHIVIGTSIATVAVIDNISIQLLLPAVCTTMAEHYMGVGSADFTSNKSLLSANSSELSVIYLSHDAIAKSYDQTAGIGVFGISWSANEIHRRYVQTSSDGTKYRVGYQRFSSAMVEITSGIQWSHTGAESTWATFDGSFNPLTYLRLCLNVTVPIWGRKIVIANKSLSAAEISDAWGLVA